MDFNSVRDRQSLAAFIQSCPIIDHHAHPLLPLASQRPEHLSAITSEASGAAQAASSSSVAYARAVNTLCESEGLQVSAGSSPKERFELYLRQRAGFQENSFTSRSFSGLQTILIDDGLRHNTKPYTYDWHSKFLKTPAKRILRIETLAEDLLVQQQQQGDRGGQAFLHALEQGIKQALQDPEVAGFKSAICYRTGLEISVGQDNTALVNFAEQASQETYKQKALRIQSKAVNDALVNLLAGAVRDHAALTGSLPKPIQFHTGLGDNDLQIRLANPSYLQPFIEAYPDVPIVLLHASYPFTKEAGYLASVFANVYLDIGEIFPMVSRHGQEEAIKDALALAPAEKLCWSTDGHFVQESYSLATRQIREGLLTVLYDMAVKGDCSFSDSARIARSILFDTANKLYGLGLEFKLSASSSSTSLTLQSKPLALLEAFLAGHPGIRFIRHSWVDYTGTVRSRVQTTQHLQRVLANPLGDGRIFAVVADGPFLLQNDTPGIPDFSATGEIPYIPDYSGLCLHPRKGYASVMGDFRMQEGGHNHHDPRSLAKQAIEKLESSGIKNVLLGFELEFHLYEAQALREGRLVPISTAHAWSTSQSLLAGGGKALQILEDIVDALQGSGVDVAQFHAESGDGQYEIPLGPLPALQAIDQLVHAREVVTYIAGINGYRATFHPRPNPAGAASGMHLHSSFEPASKQGAFYAGVLQELPSICAFSLGGLHSYDRVVDGAWSGGTWCAWGHQNRDAALRRIDESDAHWELKAFDGLANPYLAVAAYLTAGRMGVEQNMHLPQPTDVPASNLTPERREVMGIRKALPRTLKEALSTFFSDKGKRTSLIGTLIDPKSRVTQFIQEFGAEPAIRYTQVKEQELALMKQLEPTKRESLSVEQVQMKSRIFMIERY